MEFKKISSPSLRDLFVEQIIEMILSGSLKIGDKLPPERQLAEAMQVSRAVVNSGISELERQGFLIVKPRSGTFVADYKRTGTLSTLAAIMNYNGGRMKDDEIRSIFEVRIALDTVLAHYGIPKMTDEDIALLRTHLEEIKKAKSFDEASEAAFKFQHEFALLSGNVLIPLVFQSFKPSVISLWKRYCELYGIEDLYQSTYQLWYFIDKRDIAGAHSYILSSMTNCIDGTRQLYYR